MLQLLAQSTSRSGHYLAFNKSIAAEAKRGFPSSVNCTTTHALAFRRVRTACHFSDWKMTTQANGNMVAEILQLPELVEFSCSSRKLTLTNRCYGSVLRDACRRFLHNTDAEPTAVHFPKYGKLEEQYSEPCDQCAVRQRCGGFFHWMTKLRSRGICPIDGTIRSSSILVALSQFNLARRLRRHLRSEEWLV
jgi:hypothetical protein